MDHLIIQVGILSYIHENDLTLKNPFQLLSHIDIDWLSDLLSQKETNNFPIVSVEILAQKEENMLRLNYLVILLILPLTCCTPTPAHTPTTTAITTPTLLERINEERTAIQSSSITETPITSAPSQIPTMNITPEIGINRMEDHKAIIVAQKALSEELGVGVETIEVLSLTSVNWSDTSLGCPKIGMMYTQVLVSGYKVILKANEKEFDIHVGDGRAVICLP